MGVILLLVLALVVATLVALFFKSKDDSPYFKSSGTRKFDLTPTLPEVKSSAPKRKARPTAMMQRRITTIPASANVQTTDSADDVATAAPLAGPPWAQVTANNGVVTTRYPNGATYVFHHPPTLRELYVREVVCRIAKPVLIGLAILVLLLYVI